MSRNNVEHVRNVFDFCKHITTCMNSSARTQNVCILFNAFLFAEIRFVFWYSFMCHKCENRISKYLLNAQYTTTTTTKLCCLCIAFVFPPFCHQFTYLPTDHLPFYVHMRCAKRCVLPLPHFWEATSLLTEHIKPCATYVCISKLPQLQSHTLTLFKWFVWMKIQCRSIYFYIISTLALFFAIPLTWKIASSSYNNWRHFRKMHYKT